MGMPIGFAGELPVNQTHSAFVQPIGCIAHMRAQAIAAGREPLYRNAHHAAICGPTI